MLKMIRFLRVNKEKREQEYLEALAKFRKNFPATDGWEINTFRDKDCKYVTTKIMKRGNVYAQASIERSNSLIEVERQSIVEALLRFGIIPEDVA